jgi:hypothetical protein
MTAVLIINVDSSPVDGAEKYLPEPAMGNMKTGSADYQLKWQEKRNKQLQELQSHAFLSKPIVIQFMFAVTDGLGFDEVCHGQCDSVKGFFENVEANKRKANFGAADGVICGPHPTTHTRIIVNTAIRHGIQVPFWATTTRRLNPWQFISTSSEGEYPVSWAGLGKKVTGPVNDTFSLLKALGAAILNPSIKE